MARLRFLAIVLLLCLASLQRRTHALGEERSGVLFNHMSSRSMNRARSRFHLRALACWLRDGGLGAVVGLGGRLMMMGCIWFLGLDVPGEVLVHGVWVLGMPLVCSVWLWPWLV